MKLRNGALQVAIGLTISFASVASQAAEHWYVGAKAGWINGSSACEDHATSCGNDTAGGGVFVGYQLNDWLALEAGYDYLGEVTADYPALGNPNVSALYKGEMQGFEVVAKPFWQLSEDLILFAKVGSLAWNMDVTGDEVNFEHTASDSGWSPLLGTGLEYYFSQNWSALIEYQWVNNVGGSSTGGTDLNMLNLGMTYHFGLTPEAELPTPTPTVAPAPVPSVHTEQQWSFYGASFASNSSKLTPDLQQAMQPVIQRLRTYPQAKVTIHTHTDSQGSSQFNLELSERRAAAVVDYLRAQGISSTQIEAKGYGETKPLADNSTESGRYQNRRVELFSPEFDVTTETSSEGR